MITKNNITGIILSGGKSSRMGTDKGLLTLNGKPFTKHVIDALEPLVSEIIIVSNHSDYDIFNKRRIEDIITDSGPVAGIASGLKASKTPYNVVLSCDIPLIKPEVLQVLINHISDDVDIIQVESHGKTMPLVAIYKSTCAETFINLLNNDERRLRHAVNQCKVKTITLPSELADSVMNVNTPEELKQLKMTINIKYFGQIAEVTQIDEETIEHTKTTVTELIESLTLKYPKLKLKDFKVAQNKELVSNETLLTGEDIAILPPFAGG
ncbi:NTP transferase domain-containing protein [Aestuariibaculum lutulentum]|uniref:Probable molybdenum cofactor guanylyltransferase n=1 Tax=Aestuariibaculum lutulentum TaxID=2920935 RepID=A0ABS9RIT5_9FLAO|nr:NTP transferase domain-containing protein [Aestuariibaculum lutulentum]MCH4552854.1 NTP transferase domain-containing protein [Aestuariibaculum lutulentum]